MFCIQCGTPNPDYAKFCGGCGKRLITPPPATETYEPEVVIRQFPVQTQASAAMSTLGIPTASRDVEVPSRPAVSKVFAIVVTVVVLAGFGILSNNISTQTRHLPTSASDVLGAYNPHPQLISVQTKGTGHTVSFYQGPHHVLELEEINGNLVWAAIRFDEKSRLFAGDGVMAVPLWMSVFIWKVCNIRENQGAELARVMHELGGYDVWSEPKEAFVNGVKIRRYMQGESLVFEAVPADSRQSQQGE